MASYWDSLMGYTRALMRGTDEGLIDDIVLGLNDGLYEGTVY
eukprot:gene11308-23662_t